MRERMHCARNSSIIIIPKGWYFHSPRIQPWDNGIAQSNLPNEGGPPAEMILVEKISQVDSHGIPGL